MEENILIRKVDGEYELFSPTKLKKSVVKSGGSEEVANRILMKIIEEGVPNTTTKIHQRVYELLLSDQSHIAARYNLKKALHTLGPTGYPFEKYIAAIYTHMGYQTNVNVKLQGACVEHEMDVIARMESQLIYIECKYHQSQSGKCNVKIPLYVKARTDDLKAFQSKIEDPETNFSFFIATNTRFTSDAVQYAGCNNINLLSWDQPVGDTLPKIIDRYGLHPVTVLTKVTSRQAHRLIELGLALVHDIPGHDRELVYAGIPKDSVDEVIGEAEAVLSLN